MTLPTYTPERRRDIAHKLGKSEQYIYQILRGIRMPSASLARKLNEIDSKILLKDLRPTDWKEIWPEQGANSSKKLEKKR